MDRLKISRNYKLLIDKKFSMKINLKKGFTLIELLVVVAIIGVLASVVLASLNTARAKGADAAIKANLANIRAQAELVYDATTPSNGYGIASNTVTGCTATGWTPTASSLFDSTGVNTKVIYNAVVAATTSASATGFCGSTTSAWVVSVPLKTNATNSWCVDSTGVSKQITGAASGTVCP